MKELSIEEKAKAYDVAVNEIKNLRDMLLEEGVINKNGVIYNNFNRIFPELAESEDEKVRKEIVNYFQCQSEEEPTRKEIHNKWIAWLEKQGEPTEINPSEFDSQLNRLLGQFKSLPKEELASSLSFYLNVVQNDGTYREEKQCEQKPQGKSALEAAKEEKVNNQNCVKPADKVEPKFKVGDVVTNKKSKDTVKIVQILHDSYCYSGWDGAATVYSDFSISEQDNWELVEQKPVWSDGSDWSDKKSEDVIEEKDMTEYEKGFECGKQLVLKYPEDFGLCKKSAWSEEDEDAIGMAIIALEDMYDPDEPNNTYAGYTMPFNKAALRLRALKERCTWKPDSSILICLEYAIKHINKDDDKRILSKLLEQLKQL